MAGTGLPAGTRTYTGHGAAGNMADPLNWDGTGGINQNSLALIPIDATLNGTVTVRQMMMLGQEAVTVNGTLATRSLGLCKSFMVCNDAVVTFTPSSTLNDAGGIIVGADETGTLIAQGNAGARSVLNTVAAKIGQNVGSNGTVTIAGAVWHNTLNMYVGQFGQGLLNVTTNGVVSTGTSFTVGATSGALGQVNLNSGGVLNVGADARVGSMTQAAGVVGNGAVSVGAGSAFNVGGQLAVSTGSAITLAGGAVSVTTGAVWVAAGGTMSGYGSISAGTAITVAGTIQATGGTLVMNGKLNGTGTVQIGAGSTAQINAATISVGKIAFIGANAALVLTHGVVDHAVMTGFAAGDSITMAGVDTLGWNGSTDVLTLSAGTQVVDTLHFAGTYAAGAFTMTQTSAGALIMLGSAHATTTH